LCCNIFEKCEETENDYDSEEEKGKNNANYEETNKTQAENTQMSISSISFLSVLR